jgi:NAD(P)-dependent dehydrogenase (short-subunit alcohol dehydrogenase family)
MLSVDLKNKVILVTGATSGIGKEIALVLSNFGAIVAFCGRNKDHGEAVLREIYSNNREGIFIEADISNRESVKNLIETILSNYRRIDIAINNAGIEGEKSPFHLDSDENWNNVININLHGIRNCLKYEITQMLKQGGGKIINIASISGLFGNQMKLSAYAASKHAVVGLTKTLALEYARDNILINAICPGMIDTPMLERTVDGKKSAKDSLAMLHPVNRLGTANDIASLAAFLCSDNATFMTGTTLTIDGGATAY